MDARRAQARGAVVGLDTMATHLEVHDDGIGVVLVGGDLLFREGLKSLFRRGQLTILGELDNIDALSDSVLRASNPKVIVAVLPDLNTRGLEGWHQTIRATWPDAHLVILAGREDDAALFDALRAGADGCLYTDMSPDALVQAIRLVSLGQNVFPTRIGRTFFTAAGRTERPKLTPRERDILQGLLAGHSNKMIANELGTTDMTVKAQLRHLLRKLGVSNRTQAALWARERGLDKNYDE